ncbi:MAG: 2-methylisocitrate lyase [Blastocatellia bacterium]|nr:MAG: 2-methylisocitrate lyase [Blastocatellia bacterium]
MTHENQLKRIEQFHELHESGCFILPNPWNPGSALYLQHLGFKALATTSAGFALTRGLTDAGMTLEIMLAHVRDIASATSLPVNADFQNGYVDEPHAVANSVSLCVQTGVAGLSIEDSTGKADAPLYEFDLGVERIQAARQAINKSGLPVVLTARCEAWLVKHPDARKIALERLVAYADAGADCLYAPGVRDIDYISDIVKAVSPKPVNVLVSSSGPDLNFRQLEDVGVRRLSVGSALARVAWSAFMRAAKEINEEGTFESLDDIAMSMELNKLFSST